MLTNTYTKSIADRWKPPAIGAFSIAVMLLFGMAMYRGLDLSFYTGLPEALRSLVDVAGDADVAGLSYGALYGSYGALTIAALALSLGAATIAGEERDGTVGLLLANPLSRTRLLASKLGAMVSLITAAMLILWGAAYAIPAALGVGIGGLHVGALTLHMFAIAVFFGMVAAAVGAWTGNRSAASGSAAGVLVVSFFAAGLLPFVSGWQGVAKVFPWYYFNGSKPLANGVSWAHLGVLAAACVVLAGVAVVGVNRRDLKEGGVAVTVLDRLRANPRTRKVMERIAGSARVSRISAKATSDHQTLIIVVGYLVVIMGVVMGPFYVLVDEALKSFAANFPKALLAMLGYADLGTAAGWYQTEVFSLTIPIAMIAVTVVIGSKALAGEEENRTMGLLLGNPLGRGSVVVEKSIAMVTAAVIVGVLTFAGTMGGSLLGHLGLSVAGVAATSALATLLGLVFGALALAVSAATGRVRVAALVTSGLALAFYVLNTFLPLNPHLAGLARWSPFYYYLTADPLNTGMPWGHAALLVGLTIGLVVLAVVGFERRDLRQTG